MQHLPKYLLIFSILSAVLISGCTDNSSIAKSLPEVQKFLADNPNAEIKAALWDEKTVSNKITEIRALCGEQMQIKPYWRIEVKDVTINTNLLLWADKDTKEVECIIRNLITQPQVIPPTQPPRNQPPEETPPIITPPIENVPPEPKNYIGVFLSSPETGDSYVLGEKVYIYLSNSGKSQVDVLGITIINADTKELVYHESLNSVIPAQSSTLIYEWDQADKDVFQVEPGNYEVQVQTSGFTSGEQFTISESD